MTNEPVCIHPRTVLLYEDEIILFYFLFFLYFIIFFFFCVTCMNNNCVGVNRSGGPFATSPFRVHPRREEFRLAGISKAEQTGELRPFPSGEGSTNGVLQKEE